MDTNEIASLYNEKLKILSAEVAEPHRLKNPDQSANCFSPVCGSEVTIDINLDTNGTISDFGWEIEACALTKSVVAILNHHIRGKTGADIAGVGTALEAMLKDNAPPPKDEWAEFDVLEPVRDYKARHNTILLPFKTIAACFLA